MVKKRFSVSVVLALCLLIASVTMPTRTAQAASPEELKEMVATIINLNGHLCAKVTEIRPLQIKDTYEVTCIEYRGGSGTVRYILDALKGTAFRA